MISDFFLYISWNVDPALYDGFITLRYYSLFFAISFLLGFSIVKKMFIHENAPIEWMDKLLMYSVIGTILGARLGHVIFYDPAYYLENISEVFMVWKGGLASHGAAIALIIAMWIFSKKVTKRHTLWTLDKLVIAVALASGFIRIGNLMNSEIVGIKTNNDIDVIVTNNSTLERNQKIFNVSAASLTGSSITIHLGSSVIAETNSIFSNGAELTITNTGTIEATNSKAINVSNSDGVSITNNNNGVIKSNNNTILGDAVSYTHLTLPTILLV